MPAEKRRSETPRTRGKRSGKLVSLPTRKKMLVTGATGFLGSHLCRRLVSEGAEVHAISRRLQSSRQADLLWWQGDLAEIEVARDLLAKIKPDVIFQLAGYPIAAREMVHVLPSLRSNFLSTVNMLIAATEMGCKRIIIAGSLEEPAEEDGPGAVPSSPYAAAKWAASAFARMFHELYKLPIVLLRVFMVYGPGQEDYQKLIPYLIGSLLRGEPPRLSSGIRKIDWIYIEDVVEGLLAAAQAQGVEGLTIEIGSGEAVSIKDLVYDLVHLVNPNIAPLFGALPDRVSEQIRVADVSRTTRLLSWKPRIPLTDGLQKTFEWYRCHLPISSHN